MSVAQFPLVGVATPSSLAGNWVSRLHRFASSRPGDSCALCGLRLPEEHLHLLDVPNRRAICACRACAITVGSASGHYRTITPRAEMLPEFQLSDAEWRALHIPIELAFLFHSTPEARPVALYPGPAGAMESLLDPESWATLVANNPDLADLEPDVEALLVNRTRGRREYFRVSVDRCYELVGIIRAQWRGLSGGAEVWQAIAAYFDRLRETNHQARTSRHG